MCARFRGPATAALSITLLTLILVAPSANAAIGDVVEWISTDSQTVVMVDRLHVIPNHICTAVNMHEYAYGARGERVEQVWRVEGRGKLQ